MCNRRLLSAARVGCAGERASPFAGNKTCAFVLFYIAAAAAVVVLLAERLALFRPKLDCVAAPRDELAN